MRITLSRRTPLTLVLATLLISLSISGCNLDNRPDPEGATATPNGPGVARPTSSGTPAAGTPVSVDEGWQVPSERQAVVRVVEQISPAVVTVVNKLDSQGFGAEASGSGVVIDAEGRIITNNHVVEGATPGSLQIIFETGETATAELLGADSISDLAVLKVDIKVPAYARLGDSTTLKVGETVIAIGSALGDFQNTVTVGVISGLNRVLRGPGVNLEGMIQTDAAINHGNSGGPLLNLSGEVIGINTAVVRGDGGLGGDVAEGLGFAIPANTVRTVSAQLIEAGKVARPFLGVATRPVTRQVASYYDLRDEAGKLLETGVLVDEVVKSSAAEKIGIRAGDVLLKIDDLPLDEDHPLANVLTAYVPGDTVRVTLLRNGKSLVLEARLGERP